MKKQKSKRAIYGSIKSFVASLDNPTSYSARQISRITGSSSHTIYRTAKRMGIRLAPAK